VAPNHACAGGLKHWGFDHKTPILFMKICSYQPALPPPHPPEPQAADHHPSSQSGSCDPHKSSPSLTASYDEISDDGMLGRHRLFSRISHLEQLFEHSLMLDYVVFGEANLIISTPSIVGLRYFASGVKTKSF